MKVELDSSNYATKIDLKNATGIYTSSFHKKVDLANLASNVEKLNIDKLKNVPTTLSNLKSKIDKLDDNEATKTVLNVVENKIPSVFNLVKKLTITQKLMNIKRKLLIIIIITTPEFNKLTAKAFAGRLKQPNLASKCDITNFVNKTDFDNKLSDFNKRINSNKTKHVLVEN